MARSPSNQQSWGALLAAPHVLFVIFVLKLLESFAYFSLSYVLVLYLSDEFDFSDQGAGWLYGFFGMLVSVYGVCVGFLIDRLGVRHSLIIGSLLLLCGRLTIGCARSPLVMQAMLLFVLPLGEAFGLPVMLVAVRRFTNDQNRRPAFALFYLVMNLGSLLSAPAVDIFRLLLPQGFRFSLWGHTIVLSAQRTLLLCGAAGTFLMLCVVLIGVHEPAEPNARERNDKGAPASPLQRRSLTPCSSTAVVLRERRFWRFFLFVSLLTGVRFIFRHLDATFPKWCVRQFGRNTPYGTILALNPLFVILLVGPLTACTVHQSAFNMIVLGAFISAISVFALAATGTLGGAMAFVSLLSVGEALWSPRLYEYSTMVAPKGSEGAYMALASAPNFVAKLAVGGLSGQLLTHFCPAEGDCDGRGLWTAIGLMTLASPLLMVLCRDLILHELPEEEMAEPHEKRGLLTDKEPPHMGTVPCGPGVSGARPQTHESSCHYRNASGVLA